MITHIYTMNSRLGTTFSLSSCFGLSCIDPMMTMYALHSFIPLPRHTHTHTHTAHFRTVVFLFVFLHLLIQQLAMIDREA